MICRQIIDGKFDDRRQVKSNSVFVLLKLLMMKCEEKSIKHDLIQPRNSQHD